MIFQLDMMIHTAIELGMEDIRKNPWLIQDILGQCVKNQYLREKYGQKHIDACKEWFLNNQVDIYLRPRSDKDRMPCVVITPGSAPEIENLKHMADSSPETIMLMPNQIDKPIPYVVKPFVPTSYSIADGTIGLPDKLKGLESVAQGMIVVNPQTGEGYSILGVDSEYIYIEPGLSVQASQLGVVPQFQYYKARIEHTFFQESCEISCYGHGEPQTAVWLHSIVLYCILRYRESLLEGNCFSQSSLSSTSLQVDPYYSGANGERAFFRSIHLTGVTENSWIKTPTRIIESVVVGQQTANGLIGGIKVLSNLDSPDFFDPEEEALITIQESE